MRTKAWWLAAAAHVGLLAGAAAGRQADAGAEERAEAPAASSASWDGEPGPAREVWDRWTIRFEAAAWAPALAGDATLPGGTSVDVEDIDADENEIEPTGRALIRGGKWSFMFRGFGFSFDDEGRAGASFDASDEISFVRGDAVDAAIDIQGFDLTAGYTVLTPIDDVERDVRVAFDLYAGARLHTLDLSIGVPGGEAAQDDGVWVEPIGGVRVAVDLPHEFGFDLTLDGGGFPGSDASSYSWDVTVAFRWMFLGQGVGGLEIGFRHLRMNLEDGDAEALEFDGALAGLFGGIVIRF
ncbi:MAG: hypothetical protein SFZ24_12320 [Planctomycetota bacterium]|nr:hypothetical protein [Planctomycetota bacterium]